MARKVKGIIGDAERYAKLLLYEATGGGLGRNIERKSELNEQIEFKEKRNLLDSLLKLGMIADKLKIEDDSEGLSELQRKLHSDLGGGNG